MAHIQIPYSPREWTKSFHETTERWIVLVCHRRSGKTTACINHLIRDAIRNSNARYAYIAPYYKQAKAVAWDMLKEYSRPIPGVKFNEAELRVDYPNGSRIQLFGADNPDALRGLGLWGVIFDEYSQQPSSIFTEVVRPALADHQGYAIWIGTPKGRNDFYRLYEEHTLDKDWYVRLLKAEDTGIISNDELEDAKKNMSIDEYNQEFNCSFDASVKGAYYAVQLEEARKANRICSVPYQMEAKVDTWWDIGISDYNTIIFTQTIGREIHIIDFYQNNNMAIPEYARILDEKGYLYGTHHLPWDSIPREKGTGKSILELMRGLLGEDKVTTVKNIAVKDGIDMARVMFNRCWFDKEKTGELIDALASYTQEWDDKKGMFRDKPLHNWASHPSDAFRYIAVGFKDQQGENKIKSFKRLVPARSI